METLSNELVAELDVLPTLMLAVADELSADTSRLAGPRASFAFVEHAWHLADLERDGFAVRIARLLAEDAPELPDFDGERAAHVGRYREREAREGVAAFVAERAANVARLAPVRGEAWARAGTQEGVGALTLADVPCRMIDHDRAHAAELVELLRAIAPACRVLPAFEALARAAKPLPCVA